MIIEFVCPTRNINFLGTFEFEGVKLGKDAEIIKSFNNQNVAKLLGSITVTSINDNISFSFSGDTGHFSVLDYNGDYRLIT